MSSGVGHRYGSDPEFLCLWCRPAVVAPIRPPSLVTSICRGCSLKNTKDKKKRKINIQKKEKKKKKERKKKEIEFLERRENYHQKLPENQQETLPSISEVTAKRAGLRYTAQPIAFLWFSSNRQQDTANPSLPPAALCHPGASGLCSFCSQAFVLFSGPHAGQGA